LHRFIERLSPRFVILSGAPQPCFLENDLWREAKNPENVSHSMQFQGILTIHSR